MAGILGVWSAIRQCRPSVSNTSVNILDRRSPLYLQIIYLKDPNGTGGGSKQYQG